MNRLEEIEADIERQSMDGACGRAYIVLDAAAAEWLSGILRTLVDAPCDWPCKLNAPGPQRWPCRVRAMVEKGGAR